LIEDIKNLSQTYCSPARQSMTFARSRSCMRLVY